MPGVVLRAARATDEAGIARLVHDVVREVYGDLIPKTAEHRAANWREGLVAESDRLIVGIVVADDDWIEDLWVRKAHRRRGIGAALLTAAERQIAERGHARAYLRVVARNLDARRFYATHGWAEAACYAHERWSFPMVEMAKALTA